MDILSIVTIGLAAGYITYLVVDSSAMPRWWYALMEWWRDRNLIGIAFHGKPFTCNLCMSFWVSVLLIIVGKLGYIINSLKPPIYNLIGELFVSAFACAGVAYLINRILDRLNTTILRQG